MKTSLKIDKGLVYGTFGIELYSLSSSVFSGHLGYRKGFYIKGIDEYVENFNDMHVGILRELNLKKYTGFFTMAKIPENFFYSNSDDIDIFMSMGISHVCFPGEECHERGTVNIIIAVYRELKISAAVDIISMVSSIKAYYLCKNGMGYATPSDAIMVSFMKGDNIEFAGPSTSLGLNISRILSLMFEKYFNGYH
ncbi:MAG: adenosylcobinamide amidohydrolase [Thermoplasmata archaeon]